MKVNRVEIDFHLSVEIDDETQEQLAKIIDRICKQNTPPGCIHWLFGVGSKPMYSRRDSAFLGKPADPNAPLGGGPSYDDSILHFETFCRPE